MTQPQKSGSLKQSDLLTDSQFRETLEFEFAALKKLVESRIFNDIFKRITDILLSLSMLTALLPLFLVVSVIILITSGGPVFFRQRRYGEKGRQFTMLKFRSMKQPLTLVPLMFCKTRDSGILCKLENDPRVTWFGKILRKTSIDELPQLFNVLLGDMSLVGPRPLIPFMLDPYENIKRTRCLVKPGITGLWQIRDRQSNTNVFQMINHDLEYIRKSCWSFDIKIIFKTIPALLNGKGAY